MAKQIVFTGKNKLAVNDFTPSPPSDDEVQVSVTCSLISNGTESIVLHRRFDPGTHWDQWVAYPFHPGYAAVGVIRKIGKNVERFSIGDRVAMRAPHASVVNFNADWCEPIPDTISNADATWFALAKITAMGARVATYKLGDSVLVIGAGPIGQMSIRWAAASGVRHLVVVDMNADRLDLARSGGATCTINKPIADAIDELARACDGKLPGIVVDTTGNAAVFELALAAVRKFGKVVVMGDTGTPANQHLSSALINKGITIVAAHDTHETDDWNSTIITDLFYQLLGSKRLSLEGLITHTFSPDEAIEAYSLAYNNQAGAMGILFDWTR